jgi:hypothetical protein
MQTGLLLIIGTVVSLLGWMLVYPVDGGADATAAEKAAELMAEPTLGKLGALMGFGGMWAVFLGILNIARRMAAADGPGSSYANVSAVFAMVLLTLGVIALGTDLAVIDASSAALGTRIMEFSEGMDFAFGLACGLMLALLGIAIALNKYFHIIVALLALIAGVIFAVSAFVAVDMLGFIGWIVMMLTALIIGGFSLKQKD